MRFKLLTFLITAVVVGSGTGYLVNRLRPDPVPNERILLSEGPIRLRQVFSKNTDKVELRYVPSCTHFGVDEFGHYLKTTAAQETIDLVINTYHIKPVDRTHNDVRRMIEGLPLAWRFASPEDLTWHAGGLGQDGNVGSWYVLGIDKGSGTLYFFSLWWDYAP